MASWIDEETARAQYHDLLRQAEHERLIRQAVRHAASRRSHRSEPRSRDVALAWIGQRLISLGQQIEMRATHAGTGDL